MILVKFSDNNIWEIRIYDDHVECFLRKGSYPDAALIMEMNPEDVNVFPYEEWKVFYAPPRWIQEQHYPIIYYVTHMLGFNGHVERIMDTRLRFYRQP
jgi:hypothetical protein